MRAIISAHILVVLWLATVSNALAQSRSLDFRPLAAEYSKTLDQIITIAGNPNALHMYEPGSGRDVTVSLSKAPISLSLDPQGTHAAVGHDSLITYINLSNGTVERMFSIPVMAGSVMLTNSWIYVLPSYSGQSVSVNIASGSVVVNQGFDYAYGGKYDSAVNAVYGSFSQSDDGLYRYDVASGPIRKSGRSSFTGVRKACGSVFFSPNGSRVYTGCGAVLTTSTDPGSDMRYFTSLPTTVQSLDHSEDARRVAVIPGPPVYPDTNSKDNVVMLFESQTLTEAGQFTLADIPGRPQTYKAHGKWVFFNTGSTQIYVIAQADPNSGLLNDFVLQTISVAPTPDCPATFATSNADIIGEGSLGTVVITAAASCRYELKSDSPWIELVSGSSAAGNGTFTYSVRANSGQQRTGTISANGTTFTIRQGSAVRSQSLTRLAYDIAALAYAKALDKIVIASGTPNEVHLYDPLSQTEKSLALTMRPLSVSVRSDGKVAAIGHDGWLSYVDLETMSLIRIYQVSVDAFSTLLASNGYAYLFPTNDFHIFSLNLATGTIQAASTNSNSQTPVLTKDEQYFYTGRSFISKWSTHDGAAKLVNDQFNAGSTCANLWISEDGQRLFSACDAAFRISNLPLEDLQANGKFSVGGLITWLADSLARQTTAVIPFTSFGSDYQGSTRLYLYGNQFLDYEGYVALQTFQVGAKTYDGFGRYVFWHLNGNLVVIEKADTNAHLLSPYAVSVLTPFTPGQVPYFIAGPGGTSFKTRGEGASTVTGSARIENIGSPPTGLAIFGSRQNDVLVSEATVPLTMPALSGRIYAEVVDKINTGLAIANPNSATANVSFYFTDEAGSDFGSGVLTIAPRGHFAAFLDQAPFNLGRTMRGTFTFTSDVPVGAIALRGHLNERSEFLWTTLPVVSGYPPYSVQILPTFADGGGWSTQFAFVNPSDLPLAGTLQFLNPAGSPSTGPPQGLQVTVDGVSATSFPYTIPPRSSRLLTTSGAGNRILVGSVQILPEGGSYAPFGVAILSEKNTEGITISEAGVSMKSASTSAFRMYVESSNDASQVRSGIAIANSFSPATVTLQVQAFTGEPIGSPTTLKIPPLGQVQMFLNEVPGFENLPTSFRGILNISANSYYQLSVVGLRARNNERSEVLITTTDPVTAPGGSNSGELMFPHFVDGGGFTTEFILFNNSDGPSQRGAILFSGSSGQPLNVQ